MIKFLRLSLHQSSLQDCCKWVLWEQHQYSSCDSSCFQENKFFLKKNFFPIYFYFIISNQTNISNFSNNKSLIWQKSSPAWWDERVDRRQTTTYDTFQQSAKQDPFKTFWKDQLYTWKVRFTVFQNHQNTIRSERFQ